MLNFTFSFQVIQYWQIGRDELITNKIDNNSFTGKLINT